jgi:hypothetical protein
MKKYTIHTRSSAPIEIAAADHHENQRSGFTEFFTAQDGCVQIRTDEILRIDVEEPPPTVGELSAELNASNARYEALYKRCNEAQAAALKHSWSRWVPGGRFAKNIFTLLSPA